MLQNIKDTFSNYGFMPHIHCYLDRGSLVWTMVVTDILIGLAYVGISITLWSLIRKIRISFSFVVLCFGIFIAACGGTHFMEVYNLWIPNYWAAAGMKVITALASVGTALYLYRLRHSIVTVAEAAKLAEQRRLDLEVLTGSLEQKVQERTLELEKTLKVRDDFFSIVSHELRTPLTTLRLKTHMMNKGIGIRLEDEASKGFAVRMSAQVERLIKLVDDMLDISRFRAGALSLNFEKEDLGAILKEVFERFLPQFQAAHIDAKLEFQGPLWIEADRLRVEQVLANLFVNVIKYAAGSPLLVRLETESSYAKIIVKDFGPGVPSDKQALIFELFERAANDQYANGLGVGLFLSKTIVEAHKGSISLNSFEGNGSEFIIKLPFKNKNHDSTIDISSKEGLH